ncbi:MAG: amidase [Myxococcota bacterium]
MNDPLRLSLVELTGALRGRLLSPVELMTAVFKRLDERNAELNSVVAMYEREALLASARESEARIARGAARPLEGVPLGVKDLEDCAGLVTSHGSIPYKDNLAEHDSVQVARLRGAGAIPIGKTNAPEFGHTAITKNLIFGVTRNPWNLELTPGGSSGGSSSALSACMLPLVTASDGGGSTRIPACFVGAFGLKPTYGRIPNESHNLWYYGDTAVQGPLTKTVADNALYLDVTAGYAPEDPSSLPHPGFSYTEKLALGVPRKLRIAYSPDLGYAVVQSDVAQAVYDAARLFEKLGHELHELKGGPPKMGQAWGMWGAFELAASNLQHLPAREADFSRSVLASMKLAWQMTPEWFREQATRRLELSRWCQSVFSDYDLLITPTVPYDPPPAKGPFPRETEGREQLDWGVASFTIPFNLSLHPAATLRVGLSRAGLPIGMQIVAERHRDELVLQAAHAFERERPWHPHWPVR